MNRISSAFVDMNDPSSISGRARNRRWDELMRRFPDLASMRVLDLGGTPEFWVDSGVRPAALTTVNMYPYPVDEPWQRHEVADACTYVPTGDYDLVVSNSLLEHVGGNYRRCQLADVVRGAAPKYWVQTPYRYFPVEPHWLFPGFQWLPLRAQMSVTRRWPMGHSANLPHEKAYEICIEVELLSKTEMIELFPGAEIWSERFGGLVKSLVAISD